MSARDRDRLARLWISGYTVRAIAVDLGITYSAAQSTIARLRQRGEDLPFRAAGRRPVGSPLAARWAS